MVVSMVYNIDEVEKILKPKGITRTSLYRAISTGNLKAIKVGKRFLVSETSLNIWLDPNWGIEADAE